MLIINLKMSHIGIGTEATKSFLCVLVVFVVQINIGKLQHNKFP